MKRARPPFASPVRISAELEQQIHHGGILRKRHNRGRVETKDRIIDSTAELGMRVEQGPHGRDIFSAEGVVKAFLNGSLTRGSLTYPLDHA